MLLHAPHSAFAPRQQRARRKRCSAAYAMGAPEQIDALYVKLKQKTFSTAPEVTVEELLALKASGARVFVCDTRTEAEHEVSSLPGAQRKEAVDWDARRAEDAKVVCMCTVGARSGVACLALRKQGLDAVNLRGGILAWTHAGQPLVVPATGEPTRRVHVYSKDWSLQAPGYEPVVFDRPPTARTLLSVLRDKLKATFG